MPQPRDTRRLAKPNEMDASVQRIVIRRAE